MSSPSTAAEAAAARVLKVCAGPTCSTESNRRVSRDSIPGVVRRCIPFTSAEKQIQPRLLSARIGAQGKIFVETSNDRAEVDAKVDAGVVVVPGSVIVK